ncbi:MAG TPA: choice-of-anchor tandem repeat GloVer-containing protein [Candidatus Cybelea sp.]|jgi:uncharacterized repeat protein (TIGR03803 family)|nr:choice-of-anchor tandem repeat GloVer-containing protein [Candidatus Cybelea sp.]
MANDTSSYGRPFAPEAAQNQFPTIHPDRRKSWISLDGKSEQNLLYISSLGAAAVYIYSLPSLTLTGTLTGLSGAEGECTDASGDVWVTLASSLVEFAPGGTTPIATLNVPGIPGSCAIDPKTGDLAVVEDGYTSGHGAILVYKNISGGPAVITNPNQHNYNWAGYDDDGDLYFDGSTAPGGTHGDAFILSYAAAGSSTAQTIKVRGGTIYQAGMVAWNSARGDLVVGDERCGNTIHSCVYSLKAGASTAQITGTTALSNYTGGDICILYQGVLLPNDTQIAGGDSEPCGSASNSVNLWQFPAGGTPTHYNDTGVPDPLGAALTTYVPGKTQAKVIAHFGGANGATPTTALISDTSGDLYGTTQAGGAYGDGTVYKLTPHGKHYTETVLHSFTGAGGDGAVPHGALLLASGGLIYGTTSAGGDATCKCGVIFSLTPGTGNGFSYATVYKFLGGADGSTPMAGLVVGSDGIMYGTTEYGGNTSCNVSGCGTMFQYTTSNGYLQDAQFSSGTGTLPLAALTPIGCGTSSCGPTEFMGVASQGGAVNSCAGGCGTIFAAVKHSGGWSIDTGYSFGSRSGDGVNPQGALTEVSAYPPSFVGVTSSGGSGCNCGTVYYADYPEVGYLAQEKVLHQFSNSSSDGSNPVGGLVVDSSGALFGATSGGGKHGVGTAFRITYSGFSADESVIYNYGGKDGGVPLAGFLLGASLQGNDTLYGTTSIDGTSKSRRPSGLGGLGLVISHEGGSGGAVTRGAPRR